MDYKLKELSHFKRRQGPLLLIIMDGIGIGREDETNAVYLANPEHLKRYREECRKQNLYIELNAHGSAVGLPSEKDMGNSEVGHNAMGAGKIYAQGAKLVNESIQTGKMFKTEVWNEFVVPVRDLDKTIHFLGLLSDGNVHSHIDQLFGLLNGVANIGIKNVRIHTLLDGRDVPERSALEYIKPLQEKLRNMMSQNEDYDYRIASGGGRMYVTMDRYESDWKVVERGWDAHVRGIVQKEEMKNGYKGYYKSPIDAIKHGRECFPEKNDQTAPPFVVIDENGKPIGRMKDGDVVINFNFRGDRAIEISKAFEKEDFIKFDREYYPNVKYLGLLQYDDAELIPKDYLVPPPEIKHTLSDFCCANNIKQFAIAETHKYGHVTYFWNGNRTGYVCPQKEVYMEIKSEPSEMIPKNPFMKADEVCAEAMGAIKGLNYDFIRVNLANGDMVGHTGLMDPTIKAVKKVDECVGKMVELNRKMHGITIITADHGNSDEMKNADNTQKTSHTLSRVPFCIVDGEWKGEYTTRNDLKRPGLGNVASTLLNLLGFEKPERYKKSLIKFVNKQ
ncbi:MAG: 2,3-bisphosphoglycerate-independent phosphoglycerate mutase [Candidatus Lokiarchaeota archaeon]|nr:2,3-bisphosphoglycerate-independent phosphoglycerate mutase [Candidatus Lokiarchaeota archaeon]